MKNLILIMAVFITVNGLAQNYIHDARKYDVSTVKIKSSDPNIEIHNLSDGALGTIFIKNNGSPTVQVSCYLDNGNILLHKFKYREPNTEIALTYIYTEIFICIQITVKDIGSYCFCNYSESRISH